ncbi:MAG TPA: DEAD/DEAH box helicase [Dermatophilaceae bacterium]|nr:DEAD/DEAH box helicase [Dermatophilaceae bacterium]
MSEPEVSEPMSAVRDAFLAGLGFEADPFQLRSIDALDAGRSVVVAAPTGSGKTVVAEYAVAKALAAGGKAFYTTPLKALSNQKYGDLVRAHGAGRVGLLTGDNSINGEAPVVVMTTEVLRNMIYAGSPTLAGLRYVVLDEVHYLQNPYRGAVWEEVIVHTPPEVDLVCLSATVSNAEEFAGWVQAVRGATAVVIEDRRPVELEHLYLVGDRSAERLHLLPTFVDGRPNPEAAALDSRAAGPPVHRGRPRRSRLYTPRRAETVERLVDEEMVPAIYFIFSRAACDDAVQQCMDYGLRLTTSEERAQIRAIAEARVELLSDADLDVLGYGPWLDGLEHGFAAHHAGLVPAFKEVVEACFSAALVKVVFATETLSLGINMPARSVVIEKLTKFGGERHEPLTPGEYTQLTGRAGRRGIDDLGYAVVLWSPFVPFDQVAGLASTRTYALTSSFRPTYNMAANLVRRYPADVAHHLLNLSFAQYNSDAEVVRLESQLERNRQSLAEAEEKARCHLGDVEEFRRLRRNPPPPSESAVAEALAKVRPGDVLVVPGGKSGGRVAVLATSQRRGGDVRVTALTPERRRVTLSPRDFRVPPRPRGRVELPVPYAPASTSFQRAVAQSLARARLSGGEEHGRRHRPAEVVEHPVAACPDATRHVRAAERAERLRREAEWLEGRIRGHAGSLARQFDRVLRVLRAWGYVDGWSLTEAGERLARTYHECDLLVAEAVGSGLFDGLDVPAVAGLASVFTYEQRRPGAASPKIHRAELRRRWEEVERLAGELHAVEEEAGLPLTRPPDPGFATAAARWAAGRPLDDVLAGQEMSGGDFVRNVKQLIDLVRQIGDAAADPNTAAAARSAADRLFRGVVAASSVVSP